MSQVNIISDSKFWLVLRRLENYKEPVSFFDFCEKFKIEEGYLLEVINFLNSLCVDIYIDLESSRKNIVFPLNWPLQDLTLKIEELTQLSKREIDYFKVYNKNLSLTHKSNFILTGKSQKDILSEQLDRASLSQEILFITFKNKTKKQIIVHRILYLGENLSIVYEDLEEKLLMSSKVDRIQSIEKLGKFNQPIFTDLEVNNLTNGYLELSEKTARLVFKIVQPYKDIDLNPKYQNLSDPYVTTNAFGEIIWASTVEKNKKLIQWLASLGNDIEIVDPEDIREEVETFLIKQFKKTA